MNNLTPRRTTRDLEAAVAAAILRACHASLKPTTAPRSARLVPIVEVPTARHTVTIRV